MYSSCALRSARRRSWVRIASTSVGKASPAAIASAKRPLDLAELPLEALLASAERRVLLGPQLAGPRHDVVDQVGRQHILAERAEDGGVEVGRGRDQELPHVPLTRPPLHT
jgi:hypothetical protein